MKIKISILFKSFRPIKNNFIYLNSVFSSSQLLAEQTKLNKSSKSLKSLQLNSGLYASETFFPDKSTKNELDSLHGDSHYVPQSVGSLSLSRINRSAIGLPVSRSLYTVLRSPHIDKKSREQFFRCVYKELIVMKTDINEVGNYLTYFKYQEKEKNKARRGQQIKIVVHYKTRFYF